MSGEAVTMQVFVGTFRNRSEHGQADVQSAQYEAQEQAWFSGTHEDESGSGDVEPPAAQGAEASGGFGRLEVSAAMTAQRGSYGEEKLPRSRRLTRRTEILSVFQRGKRSRTAHLDVFDSASPVAFSRVGVVVPRHRHRIVDRNLLKRRLREILRREVLPYLMRHEIAADVLVRARREAYDATFGALREEMLGWLESRWLHASSC
jgi:ribonuclease P protein component